MAARAGHAAGAAVLGAVAEDADAVLPQGARPRWCPRGRRGGGPRSGWSPSGRPTQDPFGAREAPRVPGRRGGGFENRSRSANAARPGSGADGPFAAPPRRVYLKAGQPIWGVAGSGLPGAPHDPASRGGSCRHELSQECSRGCRSEGIEFIDLKMLDLAGRLHHISFPVERFTEDVLADGIGFDGSSYGFLKVENSDMVLIPDLATAALDPFRAPPDPDHVRRGPPDRRRAHALPPGQPRHRPQGRGSPARRRRGRLVPLGARSTSSTSSRRPASAPAWTRPPTGSPAPRASTRTPTTPAIPSTATTTSATRSAR